MDSATVSSMESLACAATGAQRGFSLAGLRQWQLAMVNRTLVQARRTRFYADRIASGPIESLEELERFPLTAQDDLKCGRLENFLCVPPDRISRIVTLQTTGSTGAPKRIGNTQRDLDSTVTFFEMGMRQLLGPGERLLICLPGNVENGVSDLLAKAMRRMGADALHYGMIADARDAARVLQEYRPHCVAGMPVQMLHLGARLERGAPLAAQGVKSLLLTADHLAASVRRRVERAFGCISYNHYGSTEMGYGAALECCAQNGLHLREGDLYFEIVNPETGKCVSSGEEGELVFTTLTREGMPLVRYRSLDRTRWMAGSCPCGSVLPRIAPPWRREGSFLEVAGTRVSRHALDNVLFDMEQILDYAVQAIDDRLLISVWGSDVDCRRIEHALGETDGLRELPVEVAAAPPDEPMPACTGKRFAG